MNNFPTVVHVDGEPVEITAETTVGEVKDRLDRAETDVLVAITDREQPDLVAAHDDIIAHEECRIEAVPDDPVVCDAVPDLATVQLEVRAPAPDESREAVVRRVTEQYVMEKN